MSCTSSLHAGSKLTSSTGNVVVLYNGVRGGKDVVFLLAAQSDREIRTVASHNFYVFTKDNIVYFLQFLQNGILVRNIRKASIHCKHVRE